MPENDSIVDTATRRADFEFAWSISFGESARRLDLRAADLFTKTGTPVERIAEIQAGLQVKLVHLIKATFPEFSGEIDQRLKREIQ